MKVWVREYVSDIVIVFYVLRAKVRKMGKAQKFFNAPTPFSVRRQI